MVSSFAGSTVGMAVPVGAGVAEAAGRSVGGGVALTSGVAGGAVGGAAVEVAGAGTVGGTAVGVAAAKTSQPARARAASNARHAGQVQRTLGKRIRDIVSSRG